MRFIPKPVSIEKEGLKHYLDRTKSQHHGCGYERFVEMLQSDLHYSKIQIAIEFGVDRKTVYRWLKAYNNQGVKK